MVLDDGYDTYFLVTSSSLTPRLDGLCPRGRELPLGGFLVRALALARKNAYNDLSSFYPPFFF